MIRKLLWTTILLAFGYLGFSSNLNCPSVTNSIAVCSGDGLTTLDLTSFNDLFTNGNGNAIVTYHVSLSDAQNNSNAITNPTSYITPNATLYPRIEDATVPCSSIGELQITVVTVPNSNSASSVICSMNGIASFDLISLIPTITSSANATVTFYASQIDANSNTNPLTSPFSTSASTNLFSRIESSTNSTCFETNTVALQIDNPISLITRVDICNGDTYTLPDGTVVSAAGEYNVLIFNGTCDEINRTIVIVNDTYDIQIDDEICDDESYTLPDGNSVNTTGTYVSVLMSSFGCDSIVTTNLTVNPTFNQAVNASVCSGDDHVLPDGTSVNTSGTYTSNLLTANGCDSVITTNLTVNPTFNEQVAATTCENENYQLPDGNIVNIEGTYTSILTSSFGCDSTIVTELTILSLEVENIADEICDGDTYMLPDGTMVDSAGTYEVFVDEGGQCNVRYIVTLSEGINCTTSVTAAYPNPAQDFVNVNAASVISSVTGTSIYLRIFDSSGNLVLLRNLPLTVVNNNNEIRVDTRQLEPGIYYVNLKKGVESHTETLVIM